MEDKISKITIISGTAFDGALVSEKDVLEVTDKNRHQAIYLISIGKAVAGEVESLETTPLKVDSNKAVGLTAQNADALVKR